MHARLAAAPFAAAPRRSRLGGALPALLAALAALAATACQHRDYAERRLALRERHLQQTQRIWERQERTAPVRLGRTLAAAERELRDDDRSTRENVRELAEWVDQDVRRWTRKQPVYRAEIERILRGRPQNIERNAIWMFY